MIKVKDVKKTAYREGFFDFMIDHSIDDNPFAHGSREADEWVEGFLSAQDFMETEDR